MQFRIAGIQISRLSKKEALERTSTMPAAPLITYIRVSTSGQGRSGLGIEAQRQTLGHFASSEGYEVARELVEVEMGKGSDALDRRPQLKAALAAARKLKCPVGVAKLDRLSRDVLYQRAHGS